MTTTVMRFAITAAGGQLGAEIVKAAIELVGNDRVVGLARTPSKAQSLGVEVRAGDYDSPADLASSLRGIDALLLVSGMDAPERRIGQHRNVIESAKKAGVRKIVYTSIQGAEEGTAFTPIVRSNRQTEQDVRESGLDWVVGRNGIYIEPDIEYLDRYVLAGGISNSAGDGRCGYTTRPELAHAYARMMTSDDHNGHTYDLHGQALTQAELAAHLNDAFGTDLTYTPMSVEEYRADRIAELGEFMGTIIAGIYQGIREGAADRPSHYLTATGRNHLGWDEYFSGLAAQR